MVDIKQFREYVIKPTLITLAEWNSKLNSRAAVELLTGTLLQESDGCYLHQISGPALGLYQMEPNTHDDIWKNYINFHPELREIMSTLVTKFESNELIGNLNYATAMARIHYWRAPKPLPTAGDLQGHALYWKNFYNTSLGKGTSEEFYRKYLKSLS